MVINCPSCKARYRLKSEKLEGRGAKITCPKCSHIFVIFSEGTAGELPEGADKSGGGNRDAIRQRIAEATRSTDTVTGAFTAVLGDDEVASASSTGKIRVVAPGPRKDRKAVATMDTSGGLEGAQAIDSEASNEATTAPQEEPDAEQDEVLDAGSLDFRSVGISTWKVKVAIGLIYDFSDIATLKKYLDDKKVTEDDLISHNAKEWVRIGELESLDQHFVEVWKEAYEKSGVTTKPKPSTSKEGQDVPGLQTAEASTGGFSASASAAGGTARPPGTYTPPAAKKSPPRKKKKKPVEEKARKPMGLYALAGVLVLALAFTFLGGEESPETQTQPTAVAAQAGEAPQQPKDLTATERDAIREEIRAKMQRRQEEIRATIDTEVPIPEDDPLVEEDRRRRLVPVPRTEGSESSVGPSEEESGSKKGSKPKYRKPIGQAGRAPNTSAPRQRTAARLEGTKTRDPGQMYYTAGIKKLNQGDAGSALTMMQKSVEKSPNCGPCWEGLGTAHKALGQEDKAASAFAKAKKLGGGDKAAGQ